MKSKSFGLKLVYRGTIYSASVDKYFNSPYYIIKFYGDFIKVFRKPIIKIYE